MEWISFSRKGVRTLFRPSISCVKCEDCRGRKRVLTPFLLSVPLGRNQPDQCAVSLPRPMVAGDVGNTRLGQVELCLLTADEPGRVLAQIWLMAYQPHVRGANLSEKATQLTAFAAGCQLFAHADLGDRVRPFLQHPFGSLSSPEQRTGEDHVQVN